MQSLQGNEMSFRSGFISKLARGAMALALGLAAFGANAAGYPERPVKIVLAYEAGGSIDFLARKVGEVLSTRIGQPVIIEPKPGAFERVASQYLLSQPADGYTALLVAVPHATNPSLFPNMPYDTKKDFAPLILLADVSQLVVVRADSEYKTFADLVKAAKAKPGQITFGTPGIATGTHLMMEMLTQQAGIEMLHVPYKGLAPLKGSVPAVTDLVADRVQAMMDFGPSVLPFVRAGKLKALAVSTKERSRATPDVPTMEESGLPGFDNSTWFAIHGPAGIPAPILNKLSTEIRAAMKDPALRARFDTNGIVAVGTTPEELLTRQKADSAKYAEVIKRANIKVD